MKNSNVHSILSELHRMLGNYIAEDFIHASQYGAITPHVREALRALAREAGRDSSRAVTKPMEKGHSRPSSASVPGSNNQSSNPLLAIVNMIRRSRRFGGTQSMLQFAKEMGLNVPARPKEGRERLAKRLAEAILLAPEPRRSDIVAQLAGNGDSQTQGWIDVIKNPRT
jgi:hypothetical protein